MCANTYFLLKYQQWPDHIHSCTNVAQCSAKQHKFLFPPIVPRIDKQRTTLHSVVRLVETLLHIHICSLFVPPPPLVSLPLGVTLRMQHSTTTNLDITHQYWKNIWKRCPEWEWTNKSVVKMNITCCFRNKNLDIILKFLFSWKSQYILKQTWKIGF